MITFCRRSWERFLSLEWLVAGCQDLEGTSSCLPASESATINTHNTTSVGHSVSSTMINTYTRATSASRHWASVRPLQRTASHKLTSLLTCWTHTCWNLAIISSGRRNCISITESENMASHSNCHQCLAFTMWIMSIRNDLRFSPSVLWHCWLGDRKGIPPVKKLGVALLVVMIWLEICTYYSSSCHHHLHNPWLQ